MRSTPGSIPGGFSGGLPPGTAVANSWPPPSAEPEPGPYGGPPAGEPGPYGGPPAGEPAGPYGGGGSRRVGPYGGDGPQQGGPPGGQYPGAPPPPGGQYPGGPHPGGQYPGSQYPGGPYAGGPYAGSPYAAPQGRGNGFAVASLVCGVVGLILALVVVGALPGLLAIALGIVGLVRARRGFPHKGLAIAGITLGVISLVIAIVISVLIGRFLGDRLTAYRDCLRLAQTTDQRRACEDQLRRGLENDTQGITAGSTTPAAGPAGSVTVLPAVVTRQRPPSRAATR